MVTELFYLLLTIGLCGIMWIPIVIERVLRIGLAETIGSKPDEINVPSWAMRLRRSHRNLVDNIVLFGALVLILNMVEKHSYTTELASLIFFYSRLVQAITHTFGIKWVRTISFVIGWLATAVIFLALI